MLTVDLGPDGLPVLMQNVTSPSVYLDLWALMDFAEDDALRDRLVAVLRRRGGTLAVSWVLLLEFSKVARDDTRGRVIELLEDLGSQLAFLQPLADRVVDEEDRLLATPPSLWDRGPHHDMDFVKMAQRCARPPRVLDVPALFELMSDPDFASQRAQMEAVATHSSALLEEKRQKYRNDPAFAATVDAPRKGETPLPQPTRYVIRELFQGLIRDEKKMTVNDWIDLLHMEVAVSYLDLVLLDRSWAARANDIRARLAKAGLLTNYARVFSKTNLAEFWEAIDVL